MEEMMSGHILLVEDEFDVRRSMTRVLELKGYEVTIATQGEEALERMREMERLDIILLDLMMPDVSGWEMRERQLEEGLWSEVPVVVMSGASGDLADEQRALEAEAHLSKPVRPADLYEVLERYG